MKLKNLLLMAICLLACCHISLKAYSTEIVFNEDFQSELFPPQGFVSLDNDTDGHEWYKRVMMDWETEQENGMAASYTYFMNEETYEEETLTPDNWLITPELALTGDGYGLSFRTKVDGFSTFESNLTILVSTTSNDPADFTHEIANLTTTSYQDWNEHFISLAEFTGQNIYIAFRHHNCTGNSELFIDDINILTLNPYDVLADNASGDKEVYAGSSAIYEISIENRGWQDDTYQVAVTSGNWYQIMGGSQISVNAGATGTAMVQVSVPETAQMGDSDLAMITVISTNDLAAECMVEINTTALSTITAGYSQNFDQVIAPALPLGWSKIIESTDEWAKIETQGWNAHSEPNMVIIDNADDLNANLILVSPEIDGDLQGMRISFFASRSQWNYPKLIIGTMSNPNDPNTFEEITTLTLADTFSQYTVNFNGYSGTNKFVAFKHSNEGANYAGVNIDNFILEEVLPYEVKLTNNSGSLSAQTGSTISYEILVNNKGDQNDTYDFSHFGATQDWTISYPENLQVVSGATAIINVYVTIPEDAQMGDQLAFNFTATSQTNATVSSSVEINATAIAMVTSFPFQEGFEGDFLPLGWTRVSGYDEGKWTRNDWESYEGVASAKAGTSFQFGDEGVSYVADEWLITPKIEFNIEPGRFYFFGKSNTVNGINEKVTILLLDDVYETTAELHQNADTLAEVYLTEDWASYIIEFPTNFVAQKHIALNYHIEGNEAEYNSIFIDEFYVGYFRSPALSIDTPEGMGTTIPEEGEHFFIENETVNLEAIPDLGWKFSHWNGPVEEENQASTTILMDDEKQVQAVFTEIPAATLPFTEDFTGMDPMSLPENWAATSENWGIFDSNDAGGEAPEISFNAWPEVIGTSRLIAPPFDASNALDLTLSFDHGLVYSFMVVCDLRVLASVDGETWTTVWEQAIDTKEIIGGNVEVNLDEYASEEKLFLAFEFEGNSIDISSWKIDNFSLTGTILQTYDLTFVVEDQDGNPINDAVVSIDGQAADPGVYVFEDLAEGTYQYTVEKDGYVTVTNDNLELTSDMTETVVMEPETFTLTFVVEDEDGNAITDAVISLDGQAAQAGDYVFEGLQEGTYSYTVEREGYFNVVYENLEVSADLTETVVMEVDNTGIATPEAGNTVVFPNPAVNHISITSGSIIDRIQLINITGKVVYDAGINSEKCEVNVNELPSGVYLLKIHNSKGISTQRLIISK